MIETITGNFYSELEYQLSIIITYIFIFMLISLYWGLYKTIENKRLKGFIRKKYLMLEYEDFVEEIRKHNL